MTSSPKRWLALSATAALASSALIGISAPAQAHPEVCVNKGEDQGEHLDEENCFTEEEIAAMDDSGAQLDVGQMASTANLKLLTTVPKVGPFSAENAFSSDLAFKGNYAYQGNYNGVTIYDISKPASPKVASVIECVGPQNDVTIYKNVLVLSVDSSRSNDGCQSVFQSAAIKESWEGVRLFDITNPEKPSLIKSIETDCGSHTNTLVPDPAKNRGLIYVSSYFPAATFPDCQLPHDKISVVEIPDAAPQNASVIAEPVLFPDGGFPGNASTRATSGCHDITAFPSKGIAAGACMGQGVLIDIRNPVEPRVIDSVTDPNFAFYHSATFSNDASKVVFTDELGGGGAPTCNPTVGPNKGANAIFRIEQTDTGPKLRHASYFKIPRTQSNTENCVAHNGNVIPVPGRDIMVQSWYQGGVSVFDFTDPDNPRELAWFDRGPLSKERLVLGGSWSAYWYKGHIYSSDIQQGFDVLKLTEGYVSANLRPSPSTLNVQSQEPLVVSRG